MNDFVAALLQPEVQEYLQTNAQADPVVIALKDIHIQHVHSAELANQIKQKQKAEKKLPLYFNTQHIIYPKGISIEQCSSEATAWVKVKLMKQYIQSNFLGFADLTGGFGVDTFFIGQHFEKIVYVEPNGELQAIAQHNHQILKLKNAVYQNINAEEFIHQTQENFTVVYIDPSRRREDQKVHGLSDCSPDVVALLPALIKTSKEVWIKTSPLLDIDAACQQLKCVSDVFVISIKNECKEVVYRCVQEQTLSIKKHFILADEKGSIVYQNFFTKEEESTIKIQYQNTQHYLYEPDVALLKAGAFQWIAKEFYLHKIALHTHLYTSDELIENFPGRVFKVTQLLKADATTVHAFISDKKANIITRNYPLKPEQLKQKLKLVDGGSHYLLAYSEEKKKQLVLAERIK
ncbi:MAG: hypothetical protein O9340_02940 [Cyclobacteriaceae bacterium]|jgi:hypothetical protein|nr:hypothetical protein [Cyclobacteriaceae bacterium]